MKKTRWHSCNVLLVGPEARQLWQFGAGSGGFVLGREETAFAGDTLPARLVAKDWRAFFQPKLNIAWLPPENVFLRVVQLPQSELSETVSMVELQLEKLSPIPVPQIVWSMQVLPHASGNMQTVIVLVAARAVVEEFLGKLEGQGFLADRLELPLLDQLRATPITEDGAWIYPEALGGKNTAMVAWWYGGVLQNLDLITLPPLNPAASLREQLLQMAWAGELEGWLTSPPRWHLVSDTPTTAEWEPALREGLEQPIETTAPLPAAELAALTCQRAAKADIKANLLPPEYSNRYQAQLVDRLWMRALFALGALYLMGVAVYGIAVGVANFRTGGVEKQVADLGPTYTNAIQLKARYQVLKERNDLKFAALDCWKIVAELMPDGLTLESWNFSDGRHLALAGTAPGDKAQQVYAFEASMRKAVVEGQPLFDPTAGERTNMRLGAGNVMNWSFTLELKRTEAL